jgi:hypothetical protein
MESAQDSPHSVGAYPTPFARRLPRDVVWADIQADIQQRMARCTARLARCATVLLAADGMLGEAQQRVFRSLGPMQTTRVRGTTTSIPGLTLTEHLSTPGPANERVGTPPLDRATWHRQQQGVLPRRCSRAAKAVCYGFECPGRGR